MADERFVAGSYSRERLASILSESIETIRDYLGCWSLEEFRADSTAQKASLWALLAGAQTSVSLALDIAPFSPPPDGISHRDRMEQRVRSGSFDYDIGVIVLSWVGFMNQLMSILVGHVEVDPDAIYRSMRRVSELELIFKAVQRD